MMDIVSAQAASPCASPSVQTASPWSGQEFDEVKRTLLAKAAGASAQSKRLRLLNRICHILERYPPLAQQGKHEPRFEKLLYKVARTGNREAADVALSRAGDPSCPDCLDTISDGYRSLQIYTTGCEDESKLSSWLKKDKYRVFRHLSRCAVRTCKTKEEFTRAFEKAFDVVFRQIHSYETKSRAREKRQKGSQQKIDKLQRVRADLAVFVLREILPVACNRLGVPGLSEALVELLVSKLEALRELCEASCGLWKALPIEPATDVRERLLKMLQKFPARNQLLHRIVGGWVTRLLSSCRVDLLQVIMANNDPVKDQLLCCYDLDEFDEEIASRGFAEWIQHQKQERESSSSSLHAANT